MHIRKFLKTEAHLDVFNNLCESGVRAVDKEGILDTCAGFGRQIVFSAGTQAQGHVVEFGNRFFFSSAKGKASMITKLLPVGKNELMRNKPLPPKLRWLTT